MKYYFYFIFTIANLLNPISNSSLWAQDSLSSPSPMDHLNNIKNKAEQAIDLAAKTLGESKPRRSKSDFLFLLNYSYFDLLLPGKYGLTLGWILNENNTLEFEYLRGSFQFIIDDLGNMVDERLSLTRRAYFGKNSLNVFYGVNYFKFGIDLSEELMQSVSPIYRSSTREIETHLVGAHIGISNRWTLKKNMTIGVDWVSWSQPVFQVYKYEKFTQNSNNAEDRDDIKKALNIASYVPRLTFLKVQFGMSF